MQFSHHLDHSTLLRLHARATRHFVGRTTSLLAGIDPAFRVLLPLSQDEATGVLAALDVMNRTERLSDGSVPIAAWLRNAAALLAFHDDARIFEEARARVAGAPPQETQESPVRATADRSFDLRDIAARVNASVSDATRVATILGVREGDTQQGSPIDARVESLLVDACRMKRSANLRALGAELGDIELTERLAALADAMDAGRWPSAVDDVWIRVQRQGDRWALDAAVGMLGLSVHVLLAPGQSTEIAPGTKLAMDATQSGARVRIFGVGESPLGAARARIWAGVRAISKRLLPRGGDTLGAGHDEGVVLLDLFVTLENGEQQ